MMGWRSAGLASLPGATLFPAATGASFRSTMDVKETARAYIVCVETPGMSAGDLTVQLRRGELMICGSKADEHEEDHLGHMVRERRFGSFERRLPVPQGVAAEGVRAEFSRGVLKVTLPKDGEISAPSRRVRIEEKVAEAEPR